MSHQGGIVLLASHPLDLLRKTVVSGLGEVIGPVIHVEVDPLAPDSLRLIILEEGVDGADRAHVREVHARFIARVEGDTIHLKGPRQGFHITPLRALYQSG